MDWGSEDMTETDDSEYEDPVDRANRLYVESCNYDLSEGMTPMTYTPPLRKNRRRRYEAGTKNETDIEESICSTIDDGFLTDEESPNSEQMVQSRTVADEDILTVIGKITAEAGRGPEVMRTLPVMKIQNCSADRSRSRRRHGPEVIQTTPVGNM